MNARDYSNSRTISHPLIQIQGSDRESSDGDEGPSGKRPPDSSSLNQKQSLSNGARINPQNLAENIVSIVNTRWRWIFLIAVSAAAFGWHAFFSH